MKGNRATTYVYARIPGEPDNEWLLIVTAENLAQAYLAEDTWTLNGYEVKLVNKMTGRRLR